MVKITKKIVAARRKFFEQRLVDIKLKEQILSNEKIEIEDWLKKRKGR